MVGKCHQISTAPKINIRIVKAFGSQYHKITGFIPSDKRITDAAVTQFGRQYRLALIEICPMQAIAAVSQFAALLAQLSGFKGKA